MSLPDEQARAVVAADKFLRELIECARGRAWDSQTPTQELAKRAQAILRHLPTPADWAIMLSRVSIPMGSPIETMLVAFRRESERRRPKVAPEPRRRKR